MGARRDSWVRGGFIRGQGRQAAMRVERGCETPKVTASAPCGAERRGG